ncbi:MAG: phosphoribosyltransferase, partial [Anaerolineae bacterium]
MDYLFENRAHAGQALVEKIAPYADRPQTVILALPRGGVPVAYEIAMAFE